MILVSVQSKSFITTSSKVSFKDKEFKIMVSLEEERFLSPSPDRVVDTAEIVVFNKNLNSLAKDGHTNNQDVSAWELCKVYEIVKAEQPIEFPLNLEKV